MGECERVGGGEAGGGSLSRSASVGCRIVQGEVGMIGWE